MNQTARKIDVEELSILSLSVDINNDQLTAKISDGRIVSIPMAWFPRLVAATSEQLNQFELSPGGFGVHWPEIDEDISIRSFVG